MSRKNPKIIGSLAAEHAQAVKVIQECYENKFGANASALAEWLGTSSSNVENWLAGVAAPSSVLLKILSAYPDLKESVWGSGQVRREDPATTSLRQRIDKLLESKFMLDHLATQIGICEGYQREQEVKKEKARILQTLKNAGVGADAIASVEREIFKRYGNSSDTPGYVHEPEETSGHPVPEETAADPTGSTAPDRARKNPRSKK